MERQLYGTTVYDIASAQLSASFCPGMGGRLLVFRAKNGSDIVIPTEPHGFDVINWPRAGAYPLVPYHNRLARAKIAVGEDVVALRPHPAAMPHTLHGPGHARPWMAGVHHANLFSMRLDYRADDDWPWDFHTEQVFELDGESLRLTMTVENRSTRPMPAGMGWHPYFASRHPIVADAGYLWSHGPDYLPGGERSRTAGNDQPVYVETAYFEAWGRARISLGGDVTATMTASPPFDFLVVHRGAPSHICVEPTTHVANAWNLGLSPSQTGAALLSPGERLTGEIEIRLSGKCDGH